MADLANLQAEFAAEGFGEGNEGEEGYDPDVLA